MAEKADVIKELKRLVATFPTANVTSEWYIEVAGQLEGFDIEAVRRAVNAGIGGCKFLPSVNQLLVFASRARDLRTTTVEAPKWPEKDVSMYRIMREEYGKAGIEMADLPESDVAGRLAEIKKAWNRQGREPLSVLQGGETEEVDYE